MNYMALKNYRKKYLIILLIIIRICNSVLARIIPLFLFTHWRLPGSHLWCAKNLLDDIMLLSAPGTEKARRSREKQAKK